jgi:hypothetical protein
MLERRRETNLVHFFAMEQRRLLCGFVDAHINWTLEERAVDCPRCRSLLGQAGSRSDEPRVQHSA